MNGEMWQFVAVMTFFVVVLLAAYWSVFIPRRTPDELDRERRKDPGEESRGNAPPRPEASTGKPEKSGARAGRQTVPG